MFGNLFERKSKRIGSRRKHDRRGDTGGTLSEQFGGRLSRDENVGSFSARVEMLESRAMLATYAQGDFAILGINSANPDSFRFTNLKAMDASDVINFTDNGFTAGATGRTGEGFLTFTAPAGGVAAGRNPSLGHPHAGPVDGLGSNLQV